MRRTAYILLADPNFLAASLSSYYDIVDRIVLSYDESGTSWTGTPIPVEQCLEIAKGIDIECKCVRSPGHFARPNNHPLDNDTHQRQVALEEASSDSDWVLQLDTDEVMLSPSRFCECLSNAHQAGASGLEYPSRWLYTRSSPGQYLEASRRFGGVSASYPGPLAVRAGSRLALARQIEDPLYRVDMRPWNTDPAHRHDAVVHEVVDPDDAVLHFSWVRSPEDMRRKFGWSGHTEDYSPPAVYKAWERRSQHPRLTAWTSPLRRKDWFRRVSVPEPPGGDPCSL